jgi:type IV secretory pathway VirB4 component
LLKTGKRRRPAAADSGVVLEKGVPRLEDLFAPAGLEELPDRLRTGGPGFARVYAATVYPREIYLGWLNGIFSVGDVDLAVYVEPVPDREVIRKLTEKVASLQAQRIIEHKRGSILKIPELDQAIADLDQMRAAIQTNRDRMFKVTALIAVHASSEEELEERCALLEDILARAAVYVRPLVFQQLDGLRSVVPAGWLRIDGMRRNFSAGGTMAMLPVSGPDFSHPQGVYLGHNLFTGSPVFFDAFIGPPHLPNQHMAVTGMAGAGKSQTLKLYGGRFLLLGGRLVILDPEGEYRKAVRHLYDGEVVAVEPGVPSGINPLELELEEPEDGPPVVNVAEKVADVRALVGLMVRGLARRELTATEVLLLEEAVRREYAERGITSDPESLWERGVREASPGVFTVGRAKKRMPTLSDLHRRLAESPGGEELATAIRPFLREHNLGIFDCESAVDLSAPAVCFDFSNVRDEFARFYAMSVTLAWVWQKFAQRLRGVRKTVLFDETWWFLRYPDTAVWLENLARRGRKYTTSLVVASQFLEEFLSRPEGRAVLNNCGTVFLLKQQPGVADQAAEVFRLPGRAAELLEAFAPGEGLLLAGGHTVALRVHTLPYEQPHVETGRLRDAGTGLSGAAGG